MLRGLEAAHCVPVTIGEQTGLGVHGNARPDNVMIHETSRLVMFIDFELSRSSKISYYPHNLFAAKFWPFSSNQRSVLLHEHDRSCIFLTLIIATG